MSQTSPALAPPLRPAASHALATPGRRLDLDRAKGIAILLVVFGHIVAQQAPPGVEWYEPLRYAIYRFHMPFFLYLSGTVVVLSGVAGAPPAAWPGVARRRAERLLLPFFALGLLILLAKLLAVQLVHVDNPPEGLWEGLQDLFWTTAQSPAVTVWYLLVLFLSTLVALPLLWLGVGTTGLVLLGLALQFLDLPPIAYLDRFAGHFLFFAAGCWVAARQERVLPAFERLQLLWWLLFGLALGLSLGGWLEPRRALLVCGLLAIPALHGVMRLPPVCNLAWPLFLGRYAMAIYLFNTIAIGLAKAALITAGIGWTARDFPVHAVVLMLAGLGLPILLKALVLRRVRPLDRLTD